MIAGKDQDIIELPALDEKEVVVDGVGRTAIPAGAGPTEIRLQNNHSAVSLAIEIPGTAMSDMIVERMRTILSQDGNIEEAGIHTVTQRKVDDAILAGKRDGGLGALARENTQALALPPGEDHDRDLIHPEPLSGMTAIDATSSTGRDLVQMNRSAHPR
jgi:hypothetical protein